MDPATHTLSGIALANACFREKWGRETVPILAVAANWPDIDAAVMLRGDPAAVLLRRTFGHSLILLPFLAVALAAIFHRFYPKLGWAKLLPLCVAGMLLHLFFDLINSFGVVLLWPLSDWRPEFGIVFILDLTLTGLLAAPLLAGKWRRNWLVPASKISLCAVAAYFAFCGLNRAWALRSLPDAQAADFSYVFPEPLGPHRWKGVVRKDDVYHVYLVHSLTGQAEPRGEIRTELKDPAVEAARQAPFARRFEWFAKAPVWTASGDEASVYDLRFSSLVVRREASFKFRFRVLPDGRVLRSK